MEKLLIGVDFSINKPAMTILYNGEYTFMAWPLSMSHNLVESYKSVNIDIFNRGLEEIKKDKMTSSELALTHVTRSLHLADIIVNYIRNFILSHNMTDYEIILASEGLSFGSFGNAALDLASYKGVFLAFLYKTFGDRISGLFTYPPISLKSTAGCACKDKIKDKKAMVHAFINEPVEHPFRTALENGRFLAKKNYMMCVDDIVDSYFALKTLMTRENV